LIVEVFLGTFSIGATKLESNGVMICIGLGVLMFLLVISIVGLLVWYKPDSLTFDKNAHVQMALSKLADDLKAAKQLQVLLREGMFYKLQKRYVQAIGAYNKAVQIDPTSSEAKIGLAIVRNYADPKDIVEPLQILDRVILEEPSSDSALYNRACIRCLAGSKFSKAEWLADLRSAITTRFEYASYAKQDPDFQSYWSDSEFLSVVESSI
jgi:tetratricopeptide (TPR) repeat protein